MANLSQSNKILEHLQKGNTLTHMEALNLFGCFRLGARVYELKRLGHDIKSRMVKANGKHFSEYRMGA